MLKAFLRANFGACVPNCNKNLTRDRVRRLNSFTTEYLDQTGNTDKKHAFIL